jgi:hypothetical protein
MKTLLLYLLIFTSVQARDNPFFPTDGELAIPFTSNKDRSKEPLQRATIEIPSQARIIQKVTIEFKNLDGSIESKSIDLDNAIDWHLPLFISQKYIQRSPLRQDSKGKKQKYSKYKKLGFIKYATFYSNNKTLKIKTKDKIIRNFLLTNPHRIILDFDRDTTLKYKTIKIKDNIFCKIRIGNHDKYYRVVVELDGYYRYNMKQIPDGYTIKLK